MRRRPYIFLARVRKEEPIPGIVNVTLLLIKEDDPVEITDGDEFVTVTMMVDPFGG